jgi:RHS repeat-associated protein
MGSQGQVVDAYAFDAWGNEITNPQSQVQNPFKYVGKHGYYWDTESALMLLGVRYYSATNGLFLSRDLIEGYGYVYADNKPTKYIDPAGLWCIKISNPPIPLPIFTYCSIIGEVCQNCYICKCPINITRHCVSVSIGGSCGFDPGFLIDRLKNLSEIERYILSFVNWLSNSVLDIGAGIIEENCEEGCPSQGSHVYIKVCLSGCLIIGGIYGCIEVGSIGFRSNLELEGFCGGLGLTISITLTLEECE